MNTKKCIKCNIIKSELDYDFSGKNRRNICKVCRYHNKKDRIHNREIVIINEKECISCNKLLSIEYFNKLKASTDGYNSYCKGCYKIKRANIIKASIKVIRYNKTCSICNTEKDISEFKITSRSHDGHYSKCKSCWEPVKWNKDKQKASEKKYIENNKEKIREKWRQAGKKINRRIRDSINHRISGLFKSDNKKKINKSIEYIGCTISYLRVWFEFLFEKNMTFDNYGEWHIDHIKPCSSFDLNKSSDIEKCFHWSNMRPCWKYENLSKGDNIDIALINTYKQKMNDFILKYPLPTQPGDIVEGTE